MDESGSSEGVSAAALPMDIVMPRGPTLRLVGSDTPPERVDKPVRGPCLVAVSALESSSDEEEVKRDEDRVNNGGTTSGVSQVEQEKPVVPMTLRLLRKSTEGGEEGGYAIANPVPAEMLLEDDYASGRHKKKKKKKSKERKVAMPRTAAELLLEIQKSVQQLTEKHNPPTAYTEEKEIDRRRRTQSASFMPVRDSFSSLKSPPLSAPVVSGHHGPFFGGTFRGKISSIANRRRLNSSNPYHHHQGEGSGRRRFTRKRRWEPEESKSSGMNTPTGELQKIKHLSENNVWTPMDDYRLLINIMQTGGNLEYCFMGTKFSCVYSISEVASRLQTLMFDEKAGILSQMAISNLHILQRRKVEKEALFSDEEEHLLKTIKMVVGGNPEVAVFKKLLEENPHIFYKSRTPKSLQQHWLELKEFHLLDGMDPRDYKDDGLHIRELFENNQSIPTADSDPAVHAEIEKEYKLVTHQIRQLKEELDGWNCMQELVVSDGVSDLHSIFSTSEFDDQTYAILKGKQVCYCMRSREILLGRHSTNNKVDADLTAEGATSKVSRRQATVQMREFGEFSIINHGKQPIFVDCLHVPFGAMTKLTDGCIIQITHIKLLFKVNEKLIKNEVKNDVKKQALMAQSALQRYKMFDPMFTSLRSPIPSSSSSASLLGMEPFIPPMMSPGFGVSSPKTTATKRKRNISTSSSVSATSSRGGSPVSFTNSVGSSSSTKGNKRGNSSRPAKHTSVSSVPVVPLSPVYGTSPLLHMPYSSNGDLTIRPTSQPTSISPFIGQFPTSPMLQSNDNEIFKKPAPVTATARFPVGKLISSVRTPIIMLPPSMSAPLPTPTSSASTGASLPSAFVPVSGSQMITEPGQLFPNSQPQFSLVSGSGVIASTAPSAISAYPPSSVGVGQVMDSTKLGLPEDVTVTQRISDSKASLTTASVSSSGSMDDATTNSLELLSDDNESDCGIKSDTSNIENEHGDLIKLPCLGLVKSTTTDVEQGVESEESLNRTSEGDSDFSDAMQS